MTGTVPVEPAEPRRVLTWHVHGTYLQLLGMVGHQFVVPVREGRPPHYRGLPPGREWPPGLVEVPVEEIPHLELDAVLHQSEETWLTDQHEILTPAQRRLPRLFLEHDPPGHAGGSCFGERHPVDDPEATVVHVTHHNDLMWDTNRVPTVVIEHGVPDRGDLYDGSLERGIVVVNNMARRGRRLGADIFRRVAEAVPLDLVGMGSHEMGGLGEVQPENLVPFASRYRFFFHPIRHTSLGLALCEAMMAGIPVVALATTEAATVIRDGIDGYVHSDVGRLMDDMQRLLTEPDLAQKVGMEGRRAAQDRFSLARFASQWSGLIEDVVVGRREEPRTRAVSERRPVDVVDVAIAESFPASDPPSWMGE